MRNLSLLALFLMAAQFGFAQKGLEFGVTFTPATSWIINDEDFAQGDDMDLQATFGYNAGAHLGINFTESMGLQVGLNLSQQGQNYINKASSSNKEDMDVYSRKLTYVRVPVLLKFNGSTEGSFTSYFRFGPHLDFLSKAVYNYDENSGSIVRMDREDIDLTQVENPFTGENYKIYNDVVFGATVEMGGAINIDENMKILVLFHLSGSLSNPEGEESYDASPYVSLTNPSAFPDDAGSASRGTAYNVMGGLTVGLTYTIGGGE
ncbi:outer membrane beta-barrel protein [Saprospira sp. CCB-QB6]|uniref:outer membrane beta-barrel protein n=1 Tax=Saprospira sp. CCB-QB6 TaxID=3023936 RepID=UPI0023498BEA|nr:outer membrane beta-barrel protein [Saprospira sp. CCB-QB6]WCL81522.1 outer membrane beta-barrel protein [Saprospira sp. CCB-QB6]